MIREQYGKTIHFLRSKIRGTYWRCLIVFVVILVAIVVVLSFMDIDSLLRNYGSQIQNGILALDGESADAETTVETIGSQTWGYYVRHNGEAALILLVLSLIPFVPFGVISLLYNAVALGLTTGIGALMIPLNPLVAFLAFVAPHGIAEYSNAALQSALAIYMCRTVTRAILRKEHDNVKEAFLNVLRAFILIVIPVIVICGFIEANITPMVISLVYNP